MLKVSGRIVEVTSGRIFRGSVFIDRGKIVRSEEDENAEGDNYILPGLIDAHIHIESSMLIPSEFARLAVLHGTVATVSDPHEIANVLGVKGVEFMIENGRKVPFRFYFGAPSCVPATAFETSGATLGKEEVRKLLERNDIWYLSEMMNFPGVLTGDSEVIAKLQAARETGKPVDGHAPGLRGDSIRKYIAAGITTDHECFTFEEAKEKILAGMKILIREGSAAKNFDALIALLADYPDRVMFCSDDKHPDGLVEGHINQLVKRAIQSGFNPVDVIRACTLNPVKHYGLDAGLLRPGDPGDFIMVDDLFNFNVLATWINGIKVAENGRSLLERIIEEEPNRFQADEIRPTDIRVKAQDKRIKVQKALDGQLITKDLYAVAKTENGWLVSDPGRDILKMIVLNRYMPSTPAVAFVSGFGLKRGAIASTVAHDSHNIIATGTTDEDIVTAVNMLVRSKGGIAIADSGRQTMLPLPVAGIMTGEDAWLVAEKYKELDELAKEMGSSLSAPFMTLSFMALLVIPSLKLGDKGLFDGNKFTFTSLFEENEI
ncbi:MAG: adenine deaminase [Bacteroidales bacterium]|nr:adenine deaminase [Bacteroidales bacterium]